MILKPRTLKTISTDNFTCEQIFKNVFQGGVFVALKQTRGEDTVILKIKIKQIPVLYLLVATALTITGFSKYSQSLF